MNLNCHRSFSENRQSGATLVICLIILVAIMLIGFVATMTSTTQYKLAGNLQFEDGAFNNSETGIGAGEKWLSAGTNFNNGGFTAYDSVTTPYLYPIGTAPNPLTMTWSDANSCSNANCLALGPTLAPNQRFFMQMVSTGERLQGSDQGIGGRQSAGCDQVNTYLVTARGVSARGAQRIVQSYYSVLSC